MPDHGSVACYRKSQAESLRRICLGIAVLAFLGALAILLIAVQAVNDPNARSGIERVVTATITFVVSLGRIRLAAGYANFGKSATRIVEAADRTLGEEDGDTTQAIKLLHEYQLARASAPLLPSWYYYLNRDHLNRLWRDYLSQTPS